MEILSLYPNRKDSTSFYRGLGVISELPRIDKEIKVKEKDLVSWCELGNVDLVFFQRPFLAGHLEVIKICQKNRKPVVIEYDDLISEVPEDNNFHKIYNEKNYNYFINILFILF